MRYLLNGFQPATPVGPQGIVYANQAAVSITKGDCLFADAAGALTNTPNAFASTFVGVAAFSYDNSGGTTRAVKIGYYPAQAGILYWVKGETTTLVEASHVGLTVDLEDCDSIDASDTTCLYYGFLITEVDVSTEAVAANTQGFAKGYFVNTADES